MQRLIAVFAMLASLQLVHAKRVRGSVQLNSLVTESNMLKFSLVEGARGKVTGTLQTPPDQTYLDNHPHKLTLCLFDEKAWDRFNQKIEEGSLCSERLKMATWSQSIEATEDKVQKFKREFPGISKSRYMYLILADCYLEEYSAHPPPLIYDVTILNDNNHLGAEDQMMPSLLLYTLLLMVVLGCGLMYLLVKQNTQLGQLHLISVLLAVAFFTQFASVSLEWLHMIVYSADGLGLRWPHSVFPADFTAEMLQGLSELTICFVLISLAFGWTLGVAGEVSSSGPLKIFSRVSRESSIFMLCVGSVQLVLELLGRQYQDDFNSFHDLEHWPGHALMFLRVLLWALFVRGLMISSRAQGEQFRFFMLQLGCLGTVWFLAFPCLVWSSRFVSLYNRHCFVETGAIVLQTFAIALLASQLLLRGQYYKLSSLSRMGTVFGGGSSGKTSKFATE